MLNLKTCPLSGGGAGSRRTLRINKQNEQINTLERTVHALSLQVQALCELAQGNDSTKGNANLGEKNPKRKGLVDTLRAEFEVWQQRAHMPSDDMVRTRLKRILQTTAKTNPNKPKAKKNQNRPRHIPNTVVPETVEQKDAQPFSWASLFADTKPPKQTFQKQSPTFQLHRQAWGAPVVQAQHIQNHVLDSSLVIACHTHEEHEKAKELLIARGFQFQATFVIFDPEGEQSVLITSPQGPRPVKANVIKSHTEAPDRKSLRSAVKDDQKKESEPGKTVFLRLTLAKRFASQELCSQVSVKPQNMPATLLPAAKQHVLQTKAAINYEAEVMCLIKIKDTKAEELLKLPLPIGVFLTQQKTDDIPIWYKQKPEQKPSEYWKYVQDTCAKTGGRMIYRPSNNASLGILGETTKEAATKEESSIALRWFLANAPHDWSPEEVTAWAQDRGFLNICGVQRHGRRTWFFRGHAPSGINNIDTKQGFSFSSGITLAPARAKPRNREEAAKVQTVWGAPEPAPNPSLVAIPSKPNDEVADTQMDDEVTQKLQHTPPRTESEAAKRAKTTPKEPWTGYFTTVPNEGRGDCAYLAIAQAMTQAAGKSSSTKKGDFKAGGRLQAQLRLLASKELEKKPKLYMIDGDLSSIATDTKRAGFSLNHTASTLLQTPAIWTFAFGLGIIHSNDGIFTSFAVMPRRPTNRLQLYIFVCKLNITNGFAHQKKSLKTFAMVGLKQPRLSLGARNSMEEETKMAPVAKPCLSLASTDPLPAGLPQIMIQVAYLAYQLKELKQH